MSSYPVKGSRQTFHEQQHLGKESRDCLLDQKSMDQFLRDIYVSVFREWVMAQNYQASDNEDVLVCEAAGGKARVSFYPDDIVELRVTDQEGKDVFYLHFRMTTLRHAVNLFQEMTDTLNKLKVKTKTRVLLSCTGGFTTGFFAQKLNDAVALLDGKYEFDARPYSELFHDAGDFDLILLAPQVSYLQPKVQEALPDQPVLSIPSAVFASYDVTGLLAFLDEENKTRQDKEATLTLPNLKVDVSHEDKILCIALIRMGERVRMVYRVYDRDNEIKVDDEMLKNHITMEDIAQLADIILHEEPGITLISISRPGHADNDLLGEWHNEDVCRYMKQRFSQKIVVTKDANDIALGYYACQDEVSTLSFVFQPVIGHGGSVGTVHEGHLINGSVTTAGEIVYNRIAYSDDYEKNKATPEGTVEWLAKNILPIITVINPELIVIYSPLMTDVKEVEDALKEMIPERYLPHLIKLEGLKEYLLMGQLLQCAGYSRDHA